MQSRLEVDDIVHRLDELALDFEFPTLGHEDVTNDYNVSIRMHAFSSSSSWIIAFERLGYWADERAFRMTANIFSPSDHIVRTRFPILIEGKDHVWEDGSLRFNPYDCRLEVNGEERELQFSESDYELAGLDKSLSPNDANGPAGLNLAVLALRLFDRELGDDLFLSAEAIAELAGVTTREVKHLLTIKDFYLPPYTVMPSQTETFRMVADVIVHQDPSRYHPTEPPNTGWADWPFEGFKLPNHDD